MGLDDLSTRGKNRGDIRHQRMHGEVLHSEKGRGRHRFHLAFCISLFIRFYPASSFKFQPRRTSSFLICVTLNRQLERAAAGRRGGHDPRSVQLTQAPLAWSGTGQREEERREVESRKRLIKENQADGGERGRETTSSETEREGEGETSTDWRRRPS